MCCCQGVGWQGERGCSYPNVDALHNDLAHLWPQLHSQSRCRPIRSRRLGACIALCSKQLMRKQLQRAHLLDSANLALVNA